MQAARSTASRKEFMLRDLRGLMPQVHSSESHQLLAHCQECCLRNKAKVMRRTASEASNKAGQPRSSSASCASHLSHSARPSTYLRQNPCMAYRQSWALRCRCVLCGSQLLGLFSRVLHMSQVGIPMQTRCSDGVSKHFRVRMTPCCVILAG